MPGLLQVFLEISGTLGHEKRSLPVKKGLG